MNEILSISVLEDQHPLVWIGGLISLGNSLPKAVALAGTCLSQPVEDYRPADKKDRRFGVDLSRVRINTAGGQACNAYVLIVAPSGVGKDIGNAAERIAEKFGYLVGTSGSAEGLIDHSRLAYRGNNVLAMLHGIQPRDEIEGMFSVQMVAVHNMAMNSMKQAMLKDQGLEARQAGTNHATKMARTFIAQIEALKRYRANSQQKIVVEHVHVNEGGQAIVGVVNPAGGGSNSKRCG